MKKYILTSGSFSTEGKTYTKGDIVELSEKEVSRMTNMIADPDAPQSVQVDTSALADANKTLKENFEVLEKRIAELEEVNAELLEQIDDQEVEL